MDAEQLDDERLSAWLDGELDAEPDERRRVEDWLREHPQDAQRVRQWAADRDALRVLLTPRTDEPLPARWRSLLLDERPATRRVARHAVAAGWFVLGGLIGAGVTGWGLRHAGAERAAAAPAAWVQRAAYAHSVYVPEPRHAVEVRAQEAHLARWLTRRIDLPVKLFDLHEQGFELVGGRLLPDGSGKSAQLMYQDNQGTRITVYLRRPDDQTDAAFRYEREGDLGVFYWVEAGAGYALVGALPKAQLLALAEAIYHQLPPPTAASEPAR